MKSALADVAELDEKDKPSEVLAKTDERSPSDIIFLPDGTALVRKPLPGRDCLKFQSMMAKGADSIQTAFPWLMVRMFSRVDGSKLKLEEILDEGGIGFEGVAVLSGEVGKLFPDSRAKLESLQQRKSLAAESTNS